MQNGKDKPPSYLRYGKLIILFFLAVALATVVTIKNPFFIAEYKLGDIARESIRAPLDFPVPGTEEMVKKGEVIVREGERMLVLMDGLGRNLAAQDLGEDVGLVIGGHAVLPKSLERFPAKLTKLRVAKARQNKT